MFGWNGKWKEDSVPTPGGIVLRLRCLTLLVVMGTACGALAVAAAGAPGDLLQAPGDLLPVQEVAGVASVAVAPVAEATSGLADTIEPIVADAPLIPDVIQPVADAVAGIGTDFQPVGSAVETVTEAVEGAAQGAVASVTGTVAPVVAAATPSVSLIDASVAPAAGSVVGVVDESRGDPVGSVSAAPPANSRTGSGPSAGEVQTGGDRDASEPSAAGARGGGVESPDPGVADTQALPPSGFPSAGSVPGGGTVAEDAGVIGSLLVWQALCWSILTGDPVASSGLFTLLLERGGVGAVAEPGRALRVDWSAAYPASGREEISAPGVTDDGWGVPFALVDPREPIGMVLFGVLGIGALCFAMAGVPRRVYAGVRLSQENSFALRTTLGLAGLVLLVAAGIGLLAS